MTDLYLREFTMADLGDVQEMDGDPLVQKFLGEVKTKRESEEGLTYLVKNSSRMKYGTRAIVHKNDQKIIGYCGLQPLPTFGYELFFGLNSRYWGRGYCTESVRQFLAFEVKDLEKVFATVHPENELSIKVLERVGFEYMEDIYYEPQKMVHKLYSKKVSFGPIKGS